MSYRFLAIPPFDKQIKRLSKKYPSLKSDFSALLDSLQMEPKQGPSLFEVCNFNLVSQDFFCNLTMVSEQKGIIVLY